MDAAVIFTNENAHPLSGVLRPGYKHVFCVVPSTTCGTSVLVDLTLSGIFYEPVEGDALDIVSYYREQGLEAYVVPYRPDARPRLPLFLNNCVGLTKHSVGIRSWAITPLQLRNYIFKERNECSLNSHSPAAAS